MSDALAHDLAAMLGPNAGIGWSTCTDDTDLWDEERAAVARAIPKRQAEFAAGRRAARAALEALGYSPMALPVGEGRAPVWPKGIRGTITHDRGLAMAAVLPSEAAFGLGIDLTEAAPLTTALCREILPHPTEQGLDPMAARVGFSAKESLFKALYPEIGTYFGFDAALFTVLSGGDRFKVTLTRPLGAIPSGTGWVGHVIRRADIILTALILPPSKVL